MRKPSLPSLEMYWWHQEV